MFASSACAVQMLLVAFSRRICCSRVCKREAQGRWPRESFETPTIRPGMLAFECIARREKRRVRPAVTQRHTKPLGAADGNVRSEFARRLATTSGSANRPRP